MIRVTVYDPAVTSLSRAALGVALALALLVVAPSSAQAAKPFRFAATPVTCVYAGTTLASVSAGAAPQAAMEPYWRRAHGGAIARGQYVTYRYQLQALRGTRWSTVATKHGYKLVGKRLTPLPTPQLAAPTGGASYRVVVKLAWIKPTSKRATDKHAELTLQGSCSATPASAAPAGSSTATAPAATPQASQTSPAPSAPTTPAVIPPTCPTFTDSSYDETSEQPVGPTMHYAAWTGPYTINGTAHYQSDSYGAGSYDFTVAGGTAPGTYTFRGIGTTARGGTFYVNYTFDVAMTDPSGSSLGSCTGRASEIITSW